MTHYERCAQRKASVWAMGAQRHAGSGRSSVREYPVWNVGAETHFFALARSVTALRFARLIFLHTYWAVTGAHKADVTPAKTWFVGKCVSMRLLQTCCKCKAAWDNLCCGIKLKQKKKKERQGFCALTHMCTSESTSALNTPLFSSTGGWKDGQFDEFMMMNRYIIKLRFIFCWCLSHTHTDTHDCTLTFRRSNKVLFLQLASAKPSGEERCLILV